MPMPMGSLLDAGKSWWPIVPGLGSSQTPRRPMVRDTRDPPHRVT
jgi:hypothetical protein